MQAVARAKREPAVRMLAEEFRGASLIEEGSGEFDPSYVITSLGARVNRLFVGGLLERFERRDTDSGAMYDLQVRDPTGAHYIRVGSFQPELLPTVEALEARWEEGETMLLLVIGKSRFFRNDEGAVYTSVRAESIIESDREAYAGWLTEASEATLRRMHWADVGAELEPSAAAYAEAGIPEDLRLGLQLARGHYGSVDAVQYEVGVRRALGLAEGGEVSEATLSERGPALVTTDGGAPAATAAPSGAGLKQPRAEIEEMVRLNDQGEGVDYATILRSCEARGHDRQLAEEALDALHEEGVLVDERFGWYRHIDDYGG